MRRIYQMALVAAVTAFATHASAQSILHDSRYEMVTTYQDQNVNFGVSTRRFPHQPGWSNFGNPHEPGWQNYASRKPSGQVIILDKQNGQLWSWYESLQTINYLGQIFPLVGTDPFARIIQVPEEKAR
ncbi:MAG: hypothetical protein WA214_01865 [Pseudolabrys sp.]